MSRDRKAEAAARAAGLLAGVALDAVFADPRRRHPVALFGQAAGALERRLHADSRARGAAFAAACAGAAAGLGLAGERAVRGRPLARAALTAAATWAVLGGTSLGREGTRMARALEDGDLDAARARLSHLCARDPAGLDAAALARATVESVAENTSDAAVAPLLWGAVAGVPGLLAYRAVNTMDAMVGYRSPRYARFGWAAARLDDAANWVPARVTGLLTVAVAPVGARPYTSGTRRGVPAVRAGEETRRWPAPTPEARRGVLRAGEDARRPAAVREYVTAEDRPVARLQEPPGWYEGRHRRAFRGQVLGAADRARRAYTTLRRDGAAHPSPNAGRCEAAFAGALGVRLGGANVYAGRVEHRPTLGDGRPPEPADIHRAVRLSRAVVVGAALLAGAVAATRRRDARR
ncbi:cobalamin biosynthesis protein [Actinomadura craniellae]|uniref:Cobalamin biosynthesis protein CobD n=1 Tax=Actinomadura craniellae TaxID=2231787 RepID=A0A365GYG5_9ACTN|nr:cobalamin biosynthesis protein [Actinomadura craniellae]